jgi:hypothetical protein
LGCFEYLYANLQNMSYFAGEITLLWSRWCVFGSGWFWCAVSMTTVRWQGWIQHDLVGGVGVFCQLWCRVVSVTCATRHQHTAVLDHCIWTIIAVHSSLIMLLLKLLHLILSLIYFCFIMKNSTLPLHPLWPGLGGRIPLPPTPCKSIPDFWTLVACPFIFRIYLVKQWELLKTFTGLFLGIFCAHLWPFLYVEICELAFLTNAKIRHFWCTVCPRERF